MKYVDMLAWFDKDGNPNPIRFRMHNSEGEKIVVRIDKVTNKETRKLCGNYVIFFHCRVATDDKCINMKILYELGSCKWGYDEGEAFIIE